MAIKEEKPKQEEKEDKEVEKAESPEWAAKLGTQIEAFTKAVEKLGEKTKQEDEEEKPKDEEKQEEEEEKPKDEEKQEEEEEEKPKDEEKQDEEEEKPKDEEKVDISAQIKDAVDKAIKKAFVDEKAVKKSKVPKDVEDVLTYEKIGKMSWPEVSAYVRKNFNK